MRVGIRNMEKIKKYRVWIYLILILFIPLSFLGVYVYDNSKVIEIKEYTILPKDDTDFEMRIETISLIDDEHYSIDGWVVDLGKKNADEKKYIKNQIVLLDEKNNELYGINTVSIDRSDVSEILNSEIDFGKCGFKGTVKMNKISSDTQYTVGIMMENNNNDEKLVKLSERKIGVNE